MGLPGSRVDEMLELVALTPAEAKRRVRNYSLGMRQRLGIAHALLGDKGLADALGDGLGDHARHDIDAGAGPVGDDDAHRARRVGLGVGARRDQEQGKHYDQLHVSHHVFSMFTVKL